VAQPVPRNADDAPADRAQAAVDFQFFRLV
jgi:hypothetical protein